MYETEAAKWDEGLPSLIEPLPAALEHDLLCIQAAEVLQMPAPAVARLPMHWVDAALTLLEARELTREQSAAGDDA